MVDATAQVVEQARQTWLQEHPNWSFYGRAAIRQGRDGGSVRVGGSSMVAVTALC